MGDLIPLRSMTPGQTAKVAKILGDPYQVHRLHELGFHAGTTVQMIQPGSPCIIRMAGHKLCFRHNDGLNVLVRPAAAI